MAVRSKNAHWKMREILRRHWVALAARHGILDEAAQAVEHLIDGIVSRTPDVINRVSGQLPAGFPVRLAAAVLEGMQDAADRLR